MLNYYFKYFFLWSYPAILSGIYFARKEKSLKILYKYIDIFIFISTISIMKSTIGQFVLAENFNGIAGASYQTLSYISAFSYGINLYMIINGKNNLRYSVFTGKLYKCIEYIFLFIQVFCALMSGGRGGIVLIFIYTIYYIFLYTDFRDIYKFFKLLILILISIIFIIFALELLLKNDVFKTSFDRVFQFISPAGGINWKGTSGRDIIYSEAIKEINENLMFGIGLFNMEGYYHNIFIDILRSGGLIYLIFVFIFAIITLMKLNLINKYEDKNKVFSVILIYPLVMLMFSGSYTTVSELWFCISFIISYRVRGDLKNEKDSICSK